MGKKISIIHNINKNTDFFDVILKVFIIGENSIYIIDRSKEVTKIEFVEILEENENTIVYEADGYTEEIQKDLAVEDEEIIKQDYYHLMSGNENVIMSRLEKIRETHPNKELIHNGKVGILITKYDDVTESEFVKEEIEDAIEILKWLGNIEE